jgi:hypothetical protein
MLMLMVSLIGVASWLSGDVFGMEPSAWLILMVVIAMAGDVAV